MRIVKSETVVRYQVEFSPREMAVLDQHPNWCQVVHPCTKHGCDSWGAATLTKRQINDVCDALGVNGREFMASQVIDS